MTSQGNSRIKCDWPSEDAIYDFKCSSTPKGYNSGQDDVLHAVSCDVMNEDEDETTAKPDMSNIPRQPLLGYHDYASARGCISLNELTFPLLSIRYLAHQPLPAMQSRKAARQDNSEYIMADFGTANPYQMYDMPFSIAL